MINQPPDFNSKRDAVHFPIVPAVAQCDLEPGDMVSADGQLGGPYLVNPWHVGPIEQGDLYWLILPPGIVQDVVHQWSHPDFDDKEAEEWLEGYCARHNIPYQELLRVAKGQKSEGWPDVKISEDCMVVIGQDAYGQLSDMFWEYLERVVKVKQVKRPDFVRCSC